MSVVLSGGWLDLVTVPSATLKHTGDNIRSPTKVISPNLNYRAQEREFFVSETEDKLFLSEAI